MTLSSGTTNPTLLKDPRQMAQAAIKQSIAPALWTKNEQFVLVLKDRLKIHPVLNHPLLEALTHGRFSQEQLKTIHLDYYHAIVEIFADALMAAQFQARQLEPRLMRGSKMYARFILGLNLLDECGFQPGITAQGNYCGNPDWAHYLLFEQVLDELGIGLTDRMEYVPSPAATALRQGLENSFEDFTAVVSLLAIAEAAIAFTSSLRSNAQVAGLDVSQGFYQCHGFTSEEETGGHDDLHEDDLWYVLMQALTPDRYDEVAVLCDQYCNLWVTFYDAQMQLLSSIEARHVADDVKFALPTLPQL
jgi:hypothetical protein